MNALSDTELEKVGWEALSDDRIYQVFDAALKTAVRAACPHPEKRLSVNDRNLFVCDLCGEEVGR